MLRKINKVKLSGLLASMLIAFLFPIFVKNGFYINFMSSSAILAITVIGFDLLAGYTGYVSFGHATFMGVGAYAAALMVSRFGFGFWFVLPIAVIFTGLIAYLLSIPVFKLRGIYFAIGTMVFGSIFYVIVYKWTSVTHGPSGLTGIVPPFSTAGFYYLVFIAMFLVAILATRLVSSPFGKAMVAIRENEKLAESTGIATVKVKRLTFTISGMIAGFSGVLMVNLMTFAVPDTFGVAMSLNFLVTAILGGLGTLVGPAVATFGLNILSQYLAQFQSLRLAVYGLVLLLVIMFLPGGIMGTIMRITAKSKAKKVKQEVKQGGGKHATVRSA